MNQLTTHGIAGGLAGITVDMVFYPLQTIKTRIMASSPQQNLSKIARSRFKGFSCQLIVSFPYSFTFFYTYQSMRHFLSKNQYKNIYASICAQILANLIRNPFQVIKQQIMVGRNDHIIKSSLQIMKNKGFKGFYIGYQPTLIRDIVFSAIQLPMYQWLRKKNILATFNNNHNNNNKNQVINSSISGAIAAVVAGFVSCPLDVIKTRLMTQKMHQQSSQFHQKSTKILSSKSTTTQTIQKILKIYQQTGIKGYFKGVGFRCSILAFGGIVYFGALQKARTILGLE